jgi:hypothetical protein
MPHLPSEGKKDSAFETSPKSFQILCQGKNKNPLWRPCRLDVRISAVEQESMVILHLLIRPVRHIFAIHETTMI